MILVFILLLFLIIAIIILLSNIKVNIQDINISNEKNKKSSYIIILGLYFLGKIPIIKFKLDKNKINQIYNKVKKIDKNKIEEIIKKETRGIGKIKNLDIKLENLKLKIWIGVEDAVITSYITAIISIIISNALPFIMDKKANCYYTVLPEYNKNFYKIQLNCIICVKMVNIINIIFKNGKGRIDKNERTSNTRTYAYRYE